MQFKNIYMLYMAYNHMMLQLQKCHKQHQGRCYWIPAWKESVWEVTYKYAPGVSEGGQGHMEVSVSSGSLERFSSTAGVWLSGEDREEEEKRGGLSLTV